MSSTGVPNVRHVSLAVSPSRTASTRGVNLALILPANDNRINIRRNLHCSVNYKQPLSYLDTANRVNFQQVWVTDQQYFLENILKVT